MKKNKLKYLCVITVLVVAACRETSTIPEDKTFEPEKAPVYTPDSPMWRKLNSPASYSFSGGVLRTETEEMYTCVMGRADTTNDSREVDNLSQINMMGNIDSKTIVTGTYHPGGNFWSVNKSDGIPRFDALLLGPFAVFGRTSVEYFSIFGSGYSLNEDYPQGINFFEDDWRTNDFNQNGDKIRSVPLTGFMANNSGYIFENDQVKQVWRFSNIRVYDRKKPFPGSFYGKFAVASARIRGKDTGFLLSESNEPEIRTTEFYQYDEVSDHWIRKTDFPGEDRFGGVIFGIKDKMYYGLGQSKTAAKGLRDIWQYDPDTDKWTRFATYPGSGNIKVAVAQVSGKVYIGFGFYVGTTAIGTEKYIGVTDFWEFNPALK